MPDALTAMYRRIAALEREVTAMRRIRQAVGWELGASHDFQRYGGGGLRWEHDGHTKQVGGWSAPNTWIQTNIDMSNYACATYGGPYVAFNGTDEYLRVANAAWMEVGNEEFLVWSWCYPTSLTVTNRSIAAIWDAAGNDRSWFLYYDVAAGAFQFITNDTGLVGANVTVTSTYAESLNEWHFVAGYYEPSTLQRIYVAQNSDTILTVDELAVGIPAALHDGVASLTIGATTQPDQFWQGKIGRVGGRGNVPSAEIDEHVNVLFQMTRDWYEE